MLYNNMVEVCFSLKMISAMLKSYITITSMQCLHVGAKEYFNLY